MSRDELLAANQMLLQKRQQLVTDKLKPIEPIVNTVASRDGMTLQDYFHALENGGYTGLETTTLETSRALWDSFNSDRHPQLKTAVRTIKKWWNERIEWGGAIILAGNSGSGKTHLGTAIYRLFGYGAIYWNELDYIKTIQSGFGGGGRTEEQLVNNCRRAKLLIYDDLGAYQTDNSKWMQGVYYRLFDRRFEERKATFITTNIPMSKELDPDTFFSPLEEWVGSRVYSRLIGALGSLDYYVSLFNVPDYRRKDW